MTLEEVQSLRNSITEIRNDENLDNMVQHIGNIAASNNAEYMNNTAQLAQTALTNFQNNFDMKVQRIDDVLAQLETILQNQ